jgi:hypothetical protein
MLAAVPAHDFVPGLPTLRGFGRSYARGRWIDRPADPGTSCGTLYAALPDAALIYGVRERILIEGRFAEAQVFTRGLAGKPARVYVERRQRCVLWRAATGEPGCRRRPLQRLSRWMRT